jgi:hypothetical protein
MRDPLIHVSWTLQLQVSMLIEGRYNFPREFSEFSGKLYEFP